MEGRWRVLIRRSIINVIIDLVLLLLDKIDGVEHHNA